ncbi:Nem1-Spo7 phosphatase regulatory subunit [Elasticomyces elasticus]|nr:Nem1-Spo7 phosphatase regulatory subunit [Elasticomyces elasticus]KAK4972848.1 Nem1-Spo7 phosphatase regulatory subunit [Elasticomyces elasticus]
MANIDQVVKGAPPPNVSPTQVASSIKSHTPTPSISTSDPLSSLPSSPPQIYLNLLILESSLRSQYLSLHTRLHLHALLLLLLTLWISTFTYLLFFRPREDGSGSGGSVYWVIETTEKLGWCGGVVTAVLFWGTGMYERGVRWPRRWVGVTNRGLRGFNLKVVVVRPSSMWVELFGWLGILDPAGWFRTPVMNFQLVPRDIESNPPASTSTSTSTVGKGQGTEYWRTHASRHGLIEEDLAPAGDSIKLLLLPKPFSPDFREGWETYRMEYWDRENARRAELRKLVKQRQRDVAYREGGWLWWTGWRGWDNVRLFSGKSRRQHDLEKLALREQPSSERLREKARERRRLERDGLLRSDSHSRSSSRSTTPTPEPPDAMAGGVSGTGSVRQKVRRGSSSASTARRPRRHATGASQGGSRLSTTESVLQGGDEGVKRMSSLDADEVKGESAEA